MNKKAKCYDKIESSFTLFGELKMKNINKNIATVSHVATPHVVTDKKITANSIDQPSFAFLISYILC